MPSESEVGRVPRRLHPLAFLFSLAGAVKTWLIPGLLVLLVAPGGRRELWLMAVFLPIVLLELARYFSLTYQLADDELVLREGIVFRNERHIPFRRIHNIDLSQNLFHRLFGVAVVRLQTASGSDPEAELRVVSLAAVEELRAGVFAKKEAAELTNHAEVEGDAATAPAADPAKAGQVLVHLGTWELVKLGLIAQRGFALLALAGLFAHELDLFERLEFDWVVQAVSSISAQHASLVVALAVLTGAVIVLLGLSIAWSILRLYDFRLERLGDEFRLECGLFTRTSAIVPRRRIQLISVHESLLHRLFGRVSVHVETAGGTDEESIGRKWFVPILPRSQVPWLLAQLRSGLNLDQAAWRQVAPKARRRMVNKTVLLALLATGLLMAVVGPWGGVAGAVLLPLGIAHAVAAAGCLAYAPTPEGIWFRSGVLTRKTSTTFADKIQVLGVSQSPLDRRWGMATLWIDTAGAGPADHKIAVRYLEEPTAHSLLRDLATMAEGSRFRW